MLSKPWLLAGAGFTLTAMGRFFIALLAVASLMVAGQAPGGKPAAAPAGPEDVVQQLFEAMATRDALAAKALFVPDAALFSLGTNGKAIKMPLEDFLNAIGSGKAVWRERIWDATIKIHGGIAIVWAPYDFHNNSAFSHCGYDSFSLLKTAAGWKISYISDTRETEGCLNPLGPPQ